MANGVWKGLAVMGSATPRPGMYYGWCIVATTFCMALVTMGARSGFGVFIIPMSEEFGWNRSTILFGVSVRPAWGEADLGEPAGHGWVYDAPRLDQPPHLSHSHLCVVMSIALGGSSVTTTSALLSKWFHRHRATVMSLNASGASLGGLLLVPFTVYLIGLVGWRATWACWV